MSEPTTTQLLEIAEATVREAMAIALDPGIGLDVRTKANRNDLVTAVDRRIEEVVAARLAQATGYPVLGEEGHTVDSFAGRVWVLDPIDGTMNYVSTHRDYAVSLALCDDADDYTDAIIITDIKEILALPRLARALVDSRGHRRYGSAALECVEVAASRAGAFVHMWVSPWDIAAASLICEEAGARVTRLDGTPMDVRHKGSILVGAPRVHASLLKRLMADAQ